MDTALLAFDVDGLHHGRLLRPFDALVWMEALEAALARLAMDDHRSSRCFLAKQDESAVTDAPHSVFMLPISHDARHARVDHVLIHAKNGFDDGAMHALKRLRQIHRPGHDSVVVVLVDIDRKDGFCDKVEHFGTSTVWQNVTPFVSFDEAHGMNLEGVESAVATELEQYGLPSYSKLEIAAERGGFLELSAYRRALEQGTIIDSAPHPVAFPASDPKQIHLQLRLRFDKPVQGPIALGRWARYGMGLFLPG